MNEFVYRIKLRHSYLEDRPRICELVLHPSRYLQSFCDFIWIILAISVFFRDFWSIWTGRTMIPHAPHRPDYPSRLMKASLIIAPVHDFSLRLVCKLETVYSGQCCFAGYYLIYVFRSFPWAVPVFWPCPGTSYEGSSLLPCTYPQSSSSSSSTPPSDGSGFGPCLPAILYSS